MHEAAEVSPQIRAVSEELRMGVAYNFIKFRGDSWLTKLLERDLDQKLNWRTVETVEGNGSSSDFMGIQYYSAFGIGWRDVLRFAGYKPKGREYGDHPGFGYLDPEGIKDILLETERRYPGKPKKVTETGFADNKDKKRPYLIMETVDRILEAKEQGANVDGILLWSLVNNLEWTAGTGIHFGLYDHKGNRLPSDDGTQISSREVWSTLSKYLNNPNEESKAKVLELHKKAKAQYESESSLVKI